MLESFPPVANRHCHTLILGSMPGKRSLDAQQYYAHPQNLFWAFIEELLDIKRDLPYRKRLEALQQQHIALWDVLKHCERESSLDSDIKHAIPNDFVMFLQQHNKISKIGFNGQKAFQVFRQQVLRDNPDFANRYDIVVLPSTSPANASIKRPDKLKAWQDFLQ